MKTHCLALLAVGLLLAAADPKDAKKQDLDQLQGTWTASSVEYNGDKVDAGIIKNLTIVVEGDKMTIKGDSPDVEKYGKATLRIDPSTMPKVIDVSMTGGDEKGVTLLGIYEVDKDEWKLCVKLFGKERPAKFESKADTQDVLAVFQREKK
jgi:uncharacterized protein (TIGR03067 family)